MNAEKIELQEAANVSWLKFCRRYRLKTDNEGMKLVFYSAFVSGSLFGAKQTTEQAIKAAIKIFS